MPEPAAISARRDSVLKVLYLLFNEGYSPGEGERVIRADICAEAVRLAEAVAAHPVVTTPECHALAALLLLQGARLESRQDKDGDLLLLEHQDRSTWNRDWIARGFRHLERAMGGDRLTSYHLEAGIAACHAAAPSWEATDWRAIVGYYDRLLEIEPSPVTALNRAVALAMVEGPEAGSPRSPASRKTRRCATIRCSTPCAVSCAVAPAGSRRRARISSARSRARGRCRRGGSSSGGCGRSDRAVSGADIMRAKGVVNTTPVARGGGIDADLHSTSHRPRRIHRARRSRTGSAAPVLAADDERPPRTLTVMGFGEVKASPDLAFIELAVETTAENAGKATTENARRTTAVIDALKKKIGDKDRVTTTGYSLQPQYANRRPGAMRRPRSPATSPATGCASRAAT